ncbi:NAD(P)H-dependent flavin oxidoreductase [Tepidicella baoligensis]|uniref:NAD(P)H-dependent flavin oxidoreductase n=1 Tax=Tepidicella baoligensis TaxID=2707016 RepID=UPI001FE5A8A8|nr:nitronate monooxygenase [Tepidicella baoligensis]
MNAKPSCWMNKLGLRLPVVQAPMAGSQGSALALAVCGAGGLGSLPAATLSLDALRQELDLLSRQAQGPWNVNFFCHTPPPHDPVREAAWLDALRPLADRFGAVLPVGQAVAGRAPFSPEALEVIRPFRPPVVSFHFGLPAPALVAEIKAWGAQVWSSATTVDEARWLERNGVDVIVAQGLEAGGHRGMFLTADVTTQSGLMALLPQIVRAVQVPVLAAGGIADPQGVRAAMALGAAGVQVGTAYLLSPEAQTHPLHRAALQSSRAGHTALTNVFTGRPARGIVNRAMRELGDGATCLSARAPAFPLAGWAMAPVRAAAEAAGLDDCTPLWAGQAAPLCEPLAAAELTRRLGEAAWAAWERAQAPTA